MFQMVPSLGICGKFLYGLQCFYPAVIFVLFNSHPFHAEATTALVLMPWALSVPWTCWQFGFIAAETVMILMCGVNGGTPGVMQVIVGYVLFSHAT